VDFKEAVRWYRMAAEQGEAKAQFNLGVMYAKGQGVPQDFKEAMQWYYLAAMQGDADAQHNLGVMYAKGEGVPQDYVLAYMWFNLAAAQGEKDARDLRDSLAKKMTAAQIEEAQKPPVSGSRDK
jgi:TPR repeat protein